MASSIPLNYYSQASLVAHEAAHDITPILQKVCRDFDPGNMAIQPQTLTYLQQSVGTNDSHKEFVSELYKIEREYQNKRAQIDKMEKQIADAQQRFFTEFKARDEDAGRAFSPFLMLDKRGSNPTETAMQSASKLSMGDFVDWKALKNANLAGPERATYKPRPISPLPDSHINLISTSSKRRKTTSRRMRTMTMVECDRKRRLWNRPHRKKTEPEARLQSLRFNPRILRIKNYVPGGTYEVPCEVVNVSRKKNFCRVDPIRSPLIDIFTPSSTSYLASGMSIRYLVVFKPKTYLPVIDRLDVWSLDGSRSTMCIHARNDPPKLKFQNVLDVGCCLTEAVTTVFMPIKNVGEHGIFCIMTEDDFQQFRPETSSLNPSPACLTSGCCTISPVTFELAASSSCEIKLKFSCPYGSTREFLENFVFVGHLGHVYRLTVKGKIISKSLRFDKCIPELTVVGENDLCHTDSSAGFVKEFDPDYVGRVKKLEWTLRNDSDLNLTYHYRQVIPNVTSDPDSLQKTSVEYGWTPFEPGFFPVHQMTPSRYSGCHPTRNDHDGCSSIFGHKEIHTFSAEHRLEENERKRAVIQMVITHVDCLGVPAEYKKTVTLTKPVIFFAVDVSVRCVPVQISFPLDVLIHKKLACAKKFRSKFSVTNSGPASLTVMTKTQGHPPSTIKFPTASVVIAAASSTSIPFTLRTSQPGTHVENVVCRVVEDGRRHSLAVVFFVKGPRIKFYPYVKLGGIRVGEIRWETFQLSNPTRMAAHWLLKCVDRKMKQCVRFEPDQGCLEPGRKGVVRVGIHSSSQQDILAKCFIRILHGPTRPLWIMARVEYPALEITPLSFQLNELYLGRNHSVEFTVENKSILPAILTWSETFDDCGHLRLTDTAKPVLVEKLSKTKVTIRIHPLLLGNFRAGRLAFQLNDKALAVVLFSGFVKGPVLHVLSACEGSLTEMFPDSLLNYPHLLSLNEARTMTFVVKNETPIPVKFTAFCQHFSAHWQPDQPITDRALIAATFRDTELPPKFKPMKIALSAQPSILANGEASVTLTITAVMWGVFNEILTIEVENGATFSLRLRFTAAGSPIRFMQLEDKGHAKPIRFSAHTPTGAVEERVVTIRNSLPYAVSVKLLTALTDQRQSRNFGCLVDFERIPLLSSHLMVVGFPEINGVPDDTIFSIVPDRLDIDARSTGTVSVKFNSSLMVMPGNVDGVLVAQARVKDRYLMGPGEPRLNSSYAPAISLPLKAEILQPRLTVEMDSDKLLFSVAAVDILDQKTTEKDSPLVSTLSFRLINHISAVVQFRISLSRPFTVIQLTERTLRDQCLVAVKMVPDGAGLYSLHQQSTAKVELACRISASELAVLLRKRPAENSDLNIRARLTLWFPAVQSPQVIPLQALIVVPRLQVSRKTIDFGVCRIRTVHEQVFHIRNFTRSKCRWRLDLEKDGSSVDFCLSVREGQLEASCDLSGKEMEVTVVFRPMRIGKQTTVLRCDGLLDETFARINITGVTVLDFGASRGPVV